MPLQTVDYTYNIRGWMTGINDPNNLNGKLFGYKIKYTDPVNTSVSSPRFNGNIAEVDWKTATNVNDNKRRYSYQYDGLNRLLQGAYSEEGLYVVNNDFYNEVLTYDLNGNIKTLKRFSNPYSGNIAEKIDDLIYNYTGNRLDLITLPPGVLNNSSGYNALENTITYDPNGNMKTHLDKGINTISYNHLNLPTSITSGSGKNQSSISYLYRADGTKLAKFSGNPLIALNRKIDYLDGFQYESILDFCIGCPMPTDNLMFVPTSEGYFDFVKNKYIYHYNDHLGNVRLSYFKNDNNSVEVLEENNYYPFGLKHTGYNALAGNPSYNYKYNGKELQETGFYDLNARFYMPDAVVFGQHDPLSEKTLQPYAYGYNNPVRYGDPTGLSGNDFVQRKDGSIYWDKNATSQATTKAGETYLGKDLTFTFNSYIDPKLWDGPLGGFATGDKLTSTITVSSNTDADNNLVSVDIKSSEPIVHKTGGLIPNNDYFPGQQNVGLDIKGMKNGSATYEQHARVNGFDKLGIEAMGYSAPNVAQKLSIGLSGNNLSVTAATDVYPSAKLTVNNSQLFKYNQPSFKATFGKEFVGYRESRSYGNDALIPVYRSLTPSPSFYTRYKK